MQPDWVGRRVSVRRVAGRGADGRWRFADVVGDLLALDDTTATIATRDDVTEVVRDEVVAARLVQPSTADELALEATAARGWRAAETAELGGWTLRANGGFTHRANSVLPLRPPGVPVADALEAAGRWYAERGLPLCLQVPTEARRLLDADLGERGFAPGPLALVLVRRLGAGAPTDGTDGPPVTLAPEPDDAWWQAFREGSVDPAATHGVLTRHDTVTFASIVLDGRVVAVGRGVVDGGWLGVTEIEVAEAYRGQRLAGRLVGALHDWGAAHGAAHAYLQVLEDNTAARRVYDRLGYWQHHEYRFRTAP